MKFLSFLLAIMILVLSGIPCSDTEAMAVEKSQGISDTKASPEHPGTTHNDVCSPFCQCSCCAVAYALPMASVIDIAPKPQFDDRSFCSYVQQHPAGVSLPIWQPPQLV